MALIKCKECGKEISDKASVCPNCACPVEKETKKVVVEREHSPIRGTYLKCGLLIDNKEMGGIDDNCSMELDVEIGKHTIVLNQFSSNGGIYHSSSKIIEINENSKDIKIVVGLVKFSIWKDLMGQSNILEIKEITGENIKVYESK